jgi:hypothetical protein
MARLHFRKARSARYRVTESACIGLLKSMALTAHKSSSDSVSGPRPGSRQRIGEQNRKPWRQRRNLLIDNVFLAQTMSRLVAEMSQEDQKRRGFS